MNFWKESALRFKSALEREQELNLMFVATLERANEEYEKLEARLAELSISRLGEE